MLNKIKHIVTFTDKDGAIVDHKTLNLANDGLIIDFTKILPMPDDEQHNWRTWSIYNWGTKFNAQDCTSDNDSITFTTTNSSPELVFLKISRDNPDITIRVDYRHGVGSSAGTMVFTGGALQ
jgi:hypothetical protein